MNIATDRRLAAAVERIADDGDVFGLRQLQRVLGTVVASVVQHLHVVGARVLPHAIMHRSNRRSGSQ